MDSVEGRFCSGKDGISNIVQLIELQFLVDNVSRLADTCNKIRNLCKDGVFKKTEHSTIMEYLGKRKEGRQVLEEWEVTWRGDGGNHCGTEQSGGGEGQ